MRPQGSLRRKTYDDVDVDDVVDDMVEQRLARHQDRMISLVGSAKQMARNCRRLREREGGWRARCGNSASSESHGFFLSFSSHGASIKICRLSDHEALSLSLSLARIHLLKRLTCG